MSSTQRFAGRAVIVTGAAQGIGRATALAFAAAGAKVMGVLPRAAREAVSRLVADEALEVLPNLKTVWMQIGVMHEGAAEKARAAGVTVVQNRCPKIDFPRIGAWGPKRG